MNRWLRTKLRLTGGLGPLHEQGVAGSLTWSLAPEGEGTKVEVTYRVGGYVAGGLDGWAAAVDRVIGEQLDRLGRFVETGSPEPPPVGE